MGYGVSLVQLVAHRPKLTAHRRLVASPSGTPASSAAMHVTSRTHTLRQVEGKGLAVYSDLYLAGTVENDGDVLVAGLALATVGSRDGE